MKTIIIKTQEELDALPDSFEEQTIIEIRSEKSVIIKVSKVYNSASIKAFNSSSVVVCNSASVVAYNSVRVEALDSASVWAYNEAKVVAQNSASVEALDSASVWAHNEAKVVAQNSASVEAYNSVKVVACNSVSVRAFDSSSVRAFNSSSVVVRNSASAEAFNSSNVKAFDSTSVEAYNSANVVANGSVCVEAYDSSSIKASNSTSVRAFDSSSVKAFDLVSVVAYNSSSILTYNSASVRAFDLSSVKAFDSSSVWAYDSASVWAHNEAKVNLFINAYLIVDSYSVVVNSLLDHSTAVFKGCPIQIREKSDTAQAREIPSTIEVSFDEWLKRGYVVADGIHKKLISQKTIGDNTIFEVEDFPKKTKSYVVKRGDLFSHGETAEKAISDLRFKISDRDLSEFEHWKLNPDIEITENEAIQGYRIITGACEFGVREFVNSIKIPKKLTPNIVLDLTKDKFGNARFARFLDKFREPQGVIKDE